MRSLSATVRLGVFFGLVLVGPLGAAATPGAAATSAAAPCETSLQQLVDDSPPDATVTVPACVYRESVTVDKPLTLDGAGAVIDGRDTAGNIVRDTWMVISASNVTIAGFTMRYANNPPQTGALRLVSGVRDVTIRDCDLGFAAGADVAIGEADDSTVEGCDIHDAGQLGVHVGGDGKNGHDNVVRDNRIHDNNTRGYDPEWEAGGLKATVQTGLLIEGNEVYGNAGPGIWCDIYCKNITVQNNRVHDNTYAGIMFEVSTGATISANDVYGNGWGKDIWAWGAGILLSSSGGADVSRNLVAWNAAGISVISQDRQDWAHSATDDYVHDNTIVAEAGQYLLFWGQDWNGELFLPGSNDRGANNRYWAPGASAGLGDFAWNGNVSSLNAFNASPGDERASFLTRPAVDSLLASAGLPVDPTARPPLQPVAEILARAWSKAWALIVLSVAVGGLGGLGVLIVLTRRVRAGRRGAERRAGPVGAPGDRGE